MDLTHFAGVLSLVTAFITFYIQTHKAGKTDVDAMGKQIKSLQQVDKEHRLELNHKEIQVGQLMYKNQALEAALGKLQKEVKVEEALETVIDGNIAILEKLEGAEVEVSNDEARV